MFSTGDAAQTRLLSKMEPGKAGDIPGSVSVKDWFKRLPKVEMLNCNTIYIAIMIIIFISFQFLQDLRCFYH
jgi:hypothetical protein